MFESLATFLFLLAAMFVMVSGAFPAPSDAHLRRAAGRLAVIAVILVFLPLVAAAIPIRYVIFFFTVASLAAYLTLEYRRRDSRSRIHPFVNYRTGGKRLIDDDDLPAAPARDDEVFHDHP